MLIMGGDLKRRESLSARLGDVFSAIYLASMVLKHHRDNGSPADDLPLVEWSCRTLLYQAQEQLHGLLRNFPNKLVARLLRFCIFPRGRTYFSPSDKLGSEIVELLIHPTAARERLSANIYKTQHPDNLLGKLQAALETVEANSALNKKLRDAAKADVVSGNTDVELIEAAQAAGVLSATEASQLLAQDAQIMELIHVDDFDPSEIGRGSTPPPATNTTA
jgi:acyl-CoA dehydrogenase